MIIFRINYLNTLPSKTKVEQGMNVLESSGENFDYDIETVTAIYDRIASVAESQVLRWVVMNDDYDVTKPIVVNIKQPSTTINNDSQIFNNIPKQLK